MRSNGFSVIEIVIAIVILSILIAATLPTYQKYILRANRSDAISSLLSLQVAEEQFRTTNPSYAPLSGVWTGVDSIKKKYTLSVTNISPSSYTLTATAQGGQASDTECAIFTLSYANSMTTLSSSSNTTCWDR